MFLFIVGLTNNKTFVCFLLAEESSDVTEQKDEVAKSNHYIDKAKKHAEQENSDLLAVLEHTEMKMHSSLPLLIVHGEFLRQFKYRYRPAHCLN